MNREPDYQLEDMGDGEWRFVASARMEAATEQFDAILESGGGKRGLTVALRAFLNEYPCHIDGLHHYAMCKMQDGKLLDALAFAHAAVAVGRRALPEGFRLDNNCLPAGWIENRPFHRALHGLMLAQDAMHQRAAAVDTARALLGCDVDDRMGVRLVLPLYLLEQDRDREALDVLEYPDLQDTFGPMEYLHALALIRLGREGETAPVFQGCLHRYPKVADYLLDTDLPRPENESPLGIVMGSDFEAWDAAVQQRQVWERTPGALDILRNARKAYLPPGSPPTT